MSSGWRGGDGIEHVADVHPGDGARRTAQRRRIREREGDHRAAQALLDATRHQPDDALVPALMKEHDAAALKGPGGRIAEHPHRGERLLLHLRLDLRRSSLSASRRAASSWARGSSSSSRHWMPMLMSSMRPAAFSRGATPKARSAAVSSRLLRPASCSSARMPATQRPARMRFRPCAISTRLLASSGTTSATVPRATRSSSVAIANDPGAPPERVQTPFERRHHVEGHPDAGERATAEATAREVRVDDHVRLGQLRARQVMIGDQHVDAVGARGRHAGVARDAVVDGHDERRLALHRERHDLGGQAVAELEAVRDQEVDGREPEPAQRPHHERGAGGTVGVEVTDHEDPARRGARAAAPPPARCPPACPTGSSRSRE